MTDEIQNDEALIPDPSPPTPRFAISVTKAAKTLPRHPLVKIDDAGVATTADPITAYTLVQAGYSVIDGLSGKEYDGTNPEK